MTIQVARPTMHEFRERALFALERFDLPDLVDVVATETPPDNEPIEWDRLHEFAEWLQTEQDEDRACSRPGRFLTQWLLTVLPSSYVDQRARDLATDWSPEDELD